MRVSVVAFTVSMTVCGLYCQKAPIMASQIRTVTRAELSSPDAWDRGRLKRITPGSRGTHMSVDQIDALSAYVELTDRSGRSYVAIFRDPSNGMAVATRGGQEFYVWDGDNLLACAIAGGVFSWSRSYFAIRAPGADVTQLITLFVTRVDDARLERLGQNVSRIDLRHAAPFPFFTAESAGGSQPGKPSLDDLDLTSGTLRLDLGSPGRRYAASFWIDLAANRLLRSVVDGKETNLRVW